MRRHTRFLTFPPLTRQRRAARRGNGTTDRAWVFALAALVTASLVLCSRAAPAAPGSTRAQSPWLAYERSNNGGEIYLVRGDGSERRRLTTNRVRDALPTVGPAWSPDGRRLIYARFNRVGNATYYVRDVDGLQVTRLAARIALYRWSPDGRRIAFQRIGSLALRGADRGGDGSLVVAGSDGSAKTLVYGRGEADAVDFDWSPDGERIAFHTSTGDLFIARHDGAERKRLARNAETPDWSPDGRWIAFLRPRRGCCLATMHVIRPDGTGLRQLLPGFVDAFADHMQWAPDGRRLAVSQTRLAVVNPNGGRVRWIRGIGLGSWSPDGRKLFSYCSSGSLCVADIASGRVRVVAGGAGGGSFAWSPDGSMFAFATEGVYVARAGGGKPVRIARVRRAWEPSWSPDGRWISFNALRGLCFVPAQGGRVRCIDANVLGGNVAVWQP
jgi:Tol biopolymer transport system component